jgi:xylan 1,4-beta-xylosidase
MPILSTASTSRTLINQIASIISTQARAFNNVGRYGLDSYAPNINGFRSPLWGRGQETPGEDAYFLTSAYAYEYITGLQGGVDPQTLKMVATAKHCAGYDLENWNGNSRLGNDLNITQQDLAEYYTPQFLASTRYAKVGSVMCSYNSVNGVPSCANSFFLADSAS